MTGTEVVQFFAILALIAVSYWWFWNWNERAQRNAFVPLSQAHYTVGRTGSIFVPSFDPYVGDGAVIFIPSADGLYPRRIKSSRCAAYLEGLGTWTKRGATVHIIVTQPNECVRLQWQELVDKHPGKLFVHLIDRNSLAESDAIGIKSQVGRLDTFHPAIMVAPAGTVHSPGVMWIEGYHPIGSKYAYNVDFINPAGAAKDERFVKYKEMYETLLQQPYVSLLPPSSAAVPSKIQARAA